jgi:REP element-mobilizing transposase RayT
MPRRARIDAAGAVHHVIGRGINRQAVFSDKKDYFDFIERLGELVLETETPCFAWALLPNHFHLLLKTGNDTISNLMKRLLTGYAVTYNRRHSRSGYLFQNRYKSIRCQEDTYLLELVRYIHLNPLRAKLVTSYDSLGSYPYCGHAALLGQRKSDWQDTKYILGLFGKRLSTARRNYSDFVEKGLEQGKRPDLVGGGLLRSCGGWAGVKSLKEAGEYQKGDERILGDGAFVSEVLSRAEEKLTNEYRIKARGFDLNRLIQRVAELMELRTEDILDGIREKKRVEARSVLSYWATDQLGITQSQLAEKLSVTQSAISHAARRGKSLVKSNSYSIFEEKFS